MAIASSSEVEHHLSVCDDLGLIERAEVEQLNERVIRLRRMLFGLRRTLLLKDAQRWRGATRQDPSNAVNPPPADP